MPITTSDHRQPAPVRPRTSEPDDGVRGASAARPAPPAPATSPANDGLARAAPRPRKTTRWRRRLVWIGVATALALLAMIALRPTPIDVEAATITRGPLEVVIAAEGRTRIPDRYVVAAPVAGRVERIALEEGDLVDAGAPLARITPLALDPQLAMQARARLAAAEAARSEAEVRVGQASDARDQARRDADRIVALAAAGGASVQERELAETRASAAEAEHRAAQARLTAARADVEAARSALLNVDPERTRGLATVVVRAPSSGRVLRVPERSERPVQAGMPLLEIGDPRTLEIVVEVLSTDAVRIAADAPVRFEGWGGSDPLTGRVLRVEPSGFTKVSALGVEEQRVNVIVALDERPPSLGDGFRVDARIIVWQAADALRIPGSALFRDGDEWTAFVVEDDRAQPRRVRIGERGAAEVQLLDGVAEGERVILFPSDRLAAGARVRAGSR